MLSVLSVFSVTLPFFALVFLGFVATKRTLLPLSAIPGLNTFVLYFALPCMLYRFGASTPIAQLLDLHLALVYLVSALTMVGFTIATTLSGTVNWNNAAMGALVAAFPNTGFMGMPMLIALLGTAAAGPTIVTIAIDLVITTSLCIALSRLDAAGEHGARTALRNAFVGMLTNPMPWAIILGGAASALQWELLGPVAKTVSLLGDAASPVALFTIGAVLARSQIQAKTATPPTTPAASQGASVTDSAPPAARSDLAGVVYVALLKLFLHPVLVLLTGLCAKQLGLSISAFALSVAVLVAALPSASNVSLLAEKFGADTGRVARIILVSTALAFVTFSLAVMLLT